MIKSPDDPLGRKVPCYYACMEAKPFRFTTLTERQKRNFWSNIKSGNPGDCWPWIAYVGPHGQGKLTIGGLQYNPTRVGWFIVHGADPFPLHVLHTCDYPRCCNPKHWFLGTNHDNILDRNRKDRGGRKLTTSAVEQIHTLSKEGQSAYKIAAQFNVTPGMIYHIRHRRAWLHVIENT